MHHGEAANSDVVDSGSCRVEDTLANIDLDKILVGVNIFELRPNARHAVINRSEPQTEIGIVELHMRFEQQAHRLNATHGFDIRDERSPGLPAIRRGY
jgi:hypothetical protein